MEDKNNQIISELKTILQNLISTSELAKKYFNDAIIDLNSKNYEKAIKNFDKAIKLLPNTELDESRKAIFYRNRGIVHLKLKKYEKAIKDFTTAITLDPESTISYNISISF